MQERGLCRLRVWHTDAYSKEAITAKRLNKVQEKSAKANKAIINLLMTYMTEK